MKLLFALSVVCTFHLVAREALADEAVSLPDAWEPSSATPYDDASLATAAPRQSPGESSTLKVGGWLLAPDATVRVRGEYRGEPSELGGRDFLNGDTARVRNAGGVLERTRLGITVSKDERWRIRITLQDARIWGIPDAQSLAGGGGGSSLGMFESFIERRSEDARPSYLRFGRQRITWGEGRLLGASEFSPYGRSLDGVRAQWTRRTTELEGLVVALDSSRPVGLQAADPAGPPRLGAALAGVRFSYAPHTLLRIEASALGRYSRSAGAGDGSRFGQSRVSGWLATGDVRVSGERQGYRYEVEGAYQLGAANPLGLDTRAFMLAGSVAKEWSRASLSPRIRLGVSYASGDAKGSTYTQFDPLLPDVARADGALTLGGLSNSLLGYAELSIKPSSDFTLFAAYRYARLAEASGDWVSAYMQSVGAASNSTETELGHQGDVRIAYHPEPAIDLTLGYSAMLYGDGARTILAAMHRGRLEANSTFTPAIGTHFVFLQAQARWP